MQVGPRAGILPGPQRDAFFSRYRTLEKKQSSKVPTHTYPMFAVSLQISPDLAKSCKRCCMTFDLFRLAMICN